MTDTQTIINFRTNKSVKQSFFALCKEQNVSATSRLNDYMRAQLKDNGIPPFNQTRTTAPHIDTAWRDELIRQS
jgi:hypothetical protein